MAKPFSPNLTIDRVKSTRHVAALVDGLERGRKTGFGSTEITEVLLCPSPVVQNIRCSTGRFYLHGLRDGEVILVASPAVQTLGVGSNDPERGGTAVGG